MAKKRVTKRPTTKAKTARSQAKEGDSKNLKYLLIIAALVLVLYWAVNRNNENNYLMQRPTAVDDNTYPQINNAEDLDKALEEINKNDPSQIDGEIRGLDTEASGI